MEKILSKLTNTDDHDIIIASILIVIIGHYYAGHGHDQNPGRFRKNREILSDQLNNYHTTISSKLNDVMKLLTIFSVIFIPLNFITGIYSTNFEVVPELKYKYSYFIIWGVMMAVVIGMLLYFK